MARPLVERSSSSFLRIIAVGLRAHEEFFDGMLTDGPTLTGAIRYPPIETSPGPAHVWASEHGDINLITALPRATAPGLPADETTPPLLRSRR